MSLYNEQLSEIRNQIDRNIHVEAILKDLYAKKALLEKKAATLADEKTAKQEDVSHLEGRSLATFFYSFIGKKDEKLEKEKKEAYEAAVRYDAAICELSAVTEDIEKYEKEHHIIFDAHIRYEKLLVKKKEEIKLLGSEEADELFELEERIAVLKNKKKELCEAISEGKKAQNTVWELYSKLDSAEGWGKYDMIGGRGMSSLIKHEYIDEAQTLAERLQVQLGRFKSELIDVNITGDISIEIDSFERFADCFFDNIFIDWFVQKRIEKAKAQVNETRKSIEEILTALSDMLIKVETHLDRAVERTNELVIKVDI